MSEILNPFELYFGQDGRPIGAGSLYIGVAGLDPQIHPVDVFYDREMTVPAMQPLNISGGYVWNCCAPTKVFAAPADYSLKVLGKNGEQVFYCQTVELLDDASRIGYLPTFAGAVTRTQADKNGDFVTLEDFGGSSASGFDNKTALENAINTGKTIKLKEGKEYYLTPLTIENKKIGIEGWGAKLKSTTANDTILRFINCSGFVAGLYIDDVARAGTTATLSTIFAKNCKDLFFIAPKIYGGKILPFCAVDCDNTHVIGGQFIGSDTNRPFALELINCSNSSFFKCRAYKVQFGFTLIGAGYKETTGEYISTRTAIQTIGMKVIDCLVDDHTGHAFDGNGVVGAAFDGCVGMNYTGTVGNATFQFKQSVNAGYGEDARDTYLNTINNCIAINCVGGFSAQKGTDLIMTNITVLNCKRAPVYINGTPRVQINGLRVRDWGTDLLNWPPLNSETSCAAVTFADGSDGGSVDNVSLLLKDTTNSNFDKLQLVKVTAANCTIGNTTINKSGIADKLHSAILIDGANCVITSAFRGQGGIYNNAAIIDNSTSTNYPISITTIIDLAVQNVQYFSDMPQRGMEVGKISVTAIDTVTGSPFYNIGYIGASGSIASSREAVSELVPITNSIVPILKPLYCAIQTVGTGKILVQVRGISYV